MVIRQDNKTKPIKSNSMLLHYSIPASLKIFITCMEMVMLLCSQFPAKQAATFLLQTPKACDCVVTVNGCLN